MIKGMNPLHGPVEGIRIEKISLDPGNSRPSRGEVRRIRGGAVEASNGRPLRDKEIGNPGAHESGGPGHKGKRGRRRGIHGTMISWEKETVKTGTPCRNSEKAPAIENSQRG